MQVDEKTLDAVRLAFANKRQEIIAHSKPWTPWALCNLLKIDDSQSPVPAELILYKALKVNAANRITIRDPIVQVKLILCTTNAPYSHAI